VVHNRKKNTYSLRKDERKFTKLPFSPSEVAKDRNILREEDTKKREQRERDK
jgi:hypothetical protein